MRSVQEISGMHLLTQKAKKSMKPPLVGKAGEVAERLKAPLSKSGIL